jgi:hypothetical protein
MYMSPNFLFFWEKKPRVKLGMHGQPGPKKLGQAEPGLLLWPCNSAPMENE